MKRLARTCPLHEAAVYLTPLHVTDHLGSVRAVIGGKDGAVYAADDYSPYGTVSSILAAESAPEPPGGVTLRDGFTGQESQPPDFGIPYVDFGARLYSPALRRWLTPDPLSEKYYGVSPYAYCLGNPILFMDADGRKVRLDKLSNTNHRVAFQRFMATKTGKQFLLRFMSKGESIVIGSERIMAADNGDRHKDAFWVYSSNYDDKPIKGQSFIFIKSSEGNLLCLGRDAASLKDMETVKNGVIQVIYLNDDMNADESTAVLGHEAFVHIKTNSDYLTNSDNGNLNNEQSVHGYLTKCINAEDDHNALANGRCTDYKAFLHELYRLLSDSYYLKYYNEDVKNHK